MGFGSVEVLREFTFPDASSPDASLQVFDSHTATPDGAVHRVQRHKAGFATNWVDTTLTLNDTVNLGLGEDARVFVWNGGLCLTSITYSRNHGFVARLYVHDVRRWVALIPPRQLKPGKNWMPFVRDGDPYFIHAVAPFRVLKPRPFDPMDGYAYLDIVAEHPLRTPNSHDKFSILRGGSNGIQVGDTIVAFGHSNIRRGKDGPSIEHRPFGIIYRPGHSVTCLEPDHDFLPEFRIIDPTSLYESDGKLHMITCETERVWTVTPQRARICRYSIPLEGILDEDSTGPWRRRLYRWTHGETSAVGRLLGSWRRPGGA